MDKTVENVQEWIEDGAKISPSIDPIEAEMLVITNSIVKLCVDDRVVFQPKGDLSAFKKEYNHEVASVTCFDGARILVRFDKENFETTQSYNTADFILMR